MSVFAYCEVCRKRREDCADQTAHKRRVGWWASWHPSPNQFFRKYFSSKREHPKELAEAQERSWLTDKDRGELRLTDNKVITFGTIAEKYWAEYASLENRRPQEYVIYKAKDALGEHRKVHPLSDAEIKAFQNDCQLIQRKWISQGLKASSVNRQFNVIRAIFARAMQWGLIHINPLTNVKSIAEEEPAKRFLDQAQIDQLFAAAHNLKQRPLPDAPARKQRLLDFMTTLSHTGARPSSIEACSWDNDDVDFVRRVIYFTTYKGQKPHRYMVPMDDVMFELLMRRAEATGRKGKVFDCSGMKLLTEQVVEQSGINKDRPKNRRFTIYGLKHCYASNLLMSGATFDEVGELLGHTDGEMVRRHYGHFTLDHLRKVQNRINLTKDVQLKVV